MTDLGTITSRRIVCTLCRHRNRIIRKRRGIPDPRCLWNILILLIAIWVAYRDHIMQIKSVVGQLRGKILSAGRLDDLFVWVEARRLLLWVLSAWLTPGRSWHPLHWRRRVSLHVICGIELPSSHLPLLGIDHDACRHRWGCALVWRSPSWWGYRIRWRACWMNVLGRHT